MPEPSPSETIELLDTEWASIRDLAGQLDADEWTRPTDVPGWTVQDNLSHIVGTERMLAGDELPDIDVSGRAHAVNPVGVTNEVWVEHYRSMPPAEVLAEFDRVTTSRLDALRAMSDEEWERIGWTPVGEAPYLVFMQIRVFDSWVHEQDMRRAVGRPGNMSGPVVDTALTQIDNALPYIVGKKASAPDGASVVFDITGPSARRIAIGVDGRASRLESVPESPDVTITMDAEAYVVLACGRRTAPELRADERVTFRGNDELGDQVVSNMNFTI